MLTACQTLGLSPCPVLPLWSGNLESWPEVYIAPGHGDTQGTFGLLIVALRMSGFGVSRGVSF